MATKGRKHTNEMEVQGQIPGWLNADMKSRSGLGLDKATQEKPRNTSGKRSDLVVWKDRAANIAFLFLAIELKTPDTELSDVQFFNDAIEKAQFWKAPYLSGSRKSRRRWSGRRDRRSRHAPKAASRISSARSRSAFSMSGLSQSSTFVTPGSIGQHLIRSAGVTKLPIGGVG